MRKWIALLMALVMVLSLCACGSAESAQPVDENTASAVVSETAVIEKEEAETASLVAEAEVPEIPEKAPFESTLPSDYTVEIDIYELVESYQEYGSREQTRSFSDFSFDQDGRLTGWGESGNGNPGDYSYEYDDNGQIVRIIHSGNYGLIVEYEYDNAGNIAKETMTEYTDASDYSVYEYAYDENGLLVGSSRVDSDAPNEMIIYNTSYELNEDGTIAAWKEIDTSDGSFEYSQYEYNDEGLVSKFTEVTDWADGDVDTYTHECVYNELGLLAETKSVYENKNTNYTTIYTYEKVGSKTLSTDEDGMMQKTDNWIYLDDNNLLPMPSSVMSGIIDGKDGLFCMEASQACYYDYYKAFAKSMSDYILPVRTVKSPVHEYYFGYLAVLQQVVGLNVSIGENGAAILKGSTEIATVTTGYRADCGYYIQIVEA